MEHDKPAKDDKQLAEETAKAVEIAAKNLARYVDLNKKVSGPSIMQIHLDQAATEAEEAAATAADHIRKFLEARRSVK